MTGENRFYREANGNGKPLDSLILDGKVPPSAKEAEIAVLGAMMLEDCFDDVISYLSELSFYLEDHQTIFRAITILHQIHSRIDIITVCDQLKKMNALEKITPYYLTTLTNNVVSSAHIEDHCRIIHEKFMLREMIRVGAECIRNGYGKEDVDPFEALETMQDRLYKLTMRSQHRNFVSASDLMFQSMQQLDQNGTIGVTTGYPLLNDLTNGWQPSDLIIIAARPSVGKTAFALNLAINAATDPVKPVPVGMISLEMSSQQLSMRMISLLSEVNLDTISKGWPKDDYSYQKVIKAMEAAIDIPIYFDDTPALNIFEVRAKARRAVTKHGIGLLIIDYLQLVKGIKEKNGLREQEISSISRSLKALAKELNIPVIALSQMNRSIETRKDGEPQLSDLRESGAIEQDADIVGFLYRPAMGDIGFLKIAKHRNGKLETLAFKTNFGIQKWYNPSARSKPDSNDFDSDKIDNY